MPTETATTITMPQLGESVTEGLVGNWLKQVGDHVAKYEPLLEVVTDKVNTEVPSPVAGVLVEILVEPDTTVAVGTGLCRIGEPEAGATTAVGTAAPGLGAVPTGPAQGPAERANGLAPADGNGARSGSDDLGSAREHVTAARRRGEVPDEATLLRARSSPVVRRLAAEHQVALAEIAGTGVAGRVTKRDLLAHLAEPPVPETPSVVAPPPIPTEVRVPAGDRLGGIAQGAPPRLGPPSSTPAPVPSAAVAVPAAAPASLPSSQWQGTPEATPAAMPAGGRATLFPGDEAIPLTPIRRLVAEHMVRSERTAPHATVVMEVDMTNVVAYRTARKEEFRRREGVDLTYLPFAVKATTLALRDHPRLNAVWDEDRIVHRRAINVGVAVALEDGLVVPVVKHADRLSITGLAHALAEAAEKARAGALAPDEVAGGTFTVNNPGTFGSLVSTPILVQPQAAILSTEAIVKRPVVIDDMIAVRSMMNLSLSIDHRVLDGLAAARFLQQIQRWLEAVDDRLSLA